MEARSSKSLDQAIADVYGLRRADPATAVRQAYALAEEAARAGYARGMAESLLAAGAAHCLASEFEAGMADIDAAAACFASLGHQLGHARCLRWRGMMLAFTGEQTQAWQCLRTALALFRELDARTDEADALNFIGIFHHERGEHQRAVEAVRRSAAIREQLGDVSGLAECENNLATVYAAGHQYALAIEACASAIRLGEQSGNALAVIGGLQNLGALHTDQGELHLASAYLAQAVEKSREVGMRRIEISALINLGDIQLRTGAFASAAARYREALRLSRSPRDRGLQVEIMTSLGLAIMGLSREQRGLRILRTALDWARGSSSPRLIYEAHRALSQAHEQCGNLAEALHHLKAYNDQKDAIAREESDRRMAVAEALAELDRIETQAELRILKAQLQPHFLFNALNSVSALMYSDLEHADRMLERLGDLLRLAVRQSASSQVLLRDEIEFVVAYLSVEQMRYGDRLRYVLDVAPGADAVLLPHHLLQPLVENAIKHGIGPRASAGLVSISARVVANLLEIVIRDDGAGLPPSFSLDQTGVGLRNTRLRLRHLFGDRHTFSISGAPGGGTQVTLRIPGA